MTSNDIREAARQLDLAVRQLREYASLIEYGVERAINIQLAMNNINFAVNAMQGYATFSREAHQLHDEIKLDLRRISDAISMGR